MRNIYLTNNGLHEILEGQDDLIQDDWILCELDENGQPYIKYLADGKPDLVEIEKQLLKESNQIRLNEIDTRLTQIDNEKVRPTSSITTAQILGNEIDQFDIDKLVALENEVIELRTERKTLV